MISREELELEDKNFRDHEKLLMAKEEKLKSQEWKLEKKADDMRDEIRSEFQSQLDDLEAREMALADKEEKWKKRQDELSRLKNRLADL